MDLVLFRSKVRQYLREVGDCQKTMAYAIGVHPNVLSHKFHGSARTVLTPGEVKRIVGYLVKCEALTDKQAVLDLIAIAGVTISQEEWASEPLKRLNSTQNSLQQQETDYYHHAVRAYRSNLPADLTPVIGRQKILKTLGSFLRNTDMRLITLTGTGGSGKTRLAIAASRQQANTFRDGLIFVGFAAITDPNQIPEELAHALQLRDLLSRKEETTPLTIIEHLKQYLADKNLLLVLDNLEHLLEGVSVISELLQAAPALKVLATSREVLNLYGETLLVVPPLDLPEMGFLPDATTLLHYGAIRLFVERARALVPDFKLTELNKQTVVEICTRLDGLPLAIELAAGRLLKFPLDILLEQLQTRLPLLVGGARNLPSRQQTMSNTICWSYDLLDESEQHIFRVMGCFRGGCSVVALEAVQLLPKDKVAEVVAGLVNKSLVYLALNHETDYRIMMFETLREFALEQLIARAEEKKVRQLHLNYYRRKVAENEQKLKGAAQLSALTWFEVEHPNILAALEWAKATAPVACLELAVNLDPFWLWRGFTLLQKHWLEAALKINLILPLAANFVTCPMDLEIKALIYYGFAISSYSATGEREYAETLVKRGLELAREQENRTLQVQALVNLALIYIYCDNNFEAAGPPLEEAMGLLDTIDAPWLAAEVLMNLGFQAIQFKDYVRAERLLEKNLGLRRRLGDRYGMAHTLWRLAILYSSKGNFEHARNLLEEDLRLARELKIPTIESFALGVMGSVLGYQREFEQAKMLLKESIRLKEELGDKNGVAYSLADLGYIALEQGNYREARLYLEKSLSIFRLEKLAVTSLLDQFAWLEHAEGNHKKSAILCASLAALINADISSAILCGTIKGLLTANKYSGISTLGLTYFSKLPELLCEILGIEAFNAAWEEGYAMSMEEGIALALSEVS